MVGEVSSTGHRDERPCMGKEAGGIVEHGTGSAFKEGMSMVGIQLVVYFLL